MNRLAAALTLLALVGCSQGDQRPAQAASAAAGQAQATAPAPTFGLASAGATAASAYEARIRQQRTFADLPDRGELLSYQRGGRHDRLADGAYTWHRVDVSEEHALRAIADGRLRLVTPSGQALDIRYDHHVEHPSGDLSWVGHIEGQPGAQTVLTFGADAVYGSIGQPGKRSLRLTTRNGSGWIVETDPDKLAGIASAGANPRKPDALAVPKVRAALADAPLVQPSAVSAAAAAATATAATTIDVLVGYTQGFASAQGGTSGVMTRLNYLVTVGNEALANSQVNARIRLVHAMQVSYTDASTNESALEQLTGYDSSSEDYTTPNAAFNALRTARETYGADLVTLVRAFRDPEQDGCGIAWLIGGGQSGVSPGDGQDYFGYSVVSDGSDRNEGDGETYFCRDETLVHELAHNMGSQHDRQAAEGDDGTLDPDDYGVFAYSFGLKTAASAGNFYTIMAYGDTGQTDFRVFSNPRTTFCGGRACGTTTNEDNARSLGQIAPVIAGFRDRVVPIGLNVRSDFNGDGNSDFIWWQPTHRLITYWLMSGNTVSSRLAATSASPGFGLMATGDFDGDGTSGDMAWTSASQIQIWLSSGTTFTRHNLGAAPAGWRIVGAGDVDGDGRSDLLWRQNVTGTFTYWRMNGAQVVYRAPGLPAGTNYQIKGIGDLNDDGRVDLVWTNNRYILVWIGTGSSFTQRIIATHPAGWNIVGLGDVDGDRHADLLWRHAGNGRFTYWLLDATSVSFRAAAVPAGLDYAIKAVGDLNGDGRVDVVWDNGRNVLTWLGTGNGFSQSLVAGGHPAGWTMLDPGAP